MCVFLKEVSVPIYFHYTFYFTLEIYVEFASPMILMNSLLSFSSWKHELIIYKNA